MVWDVTVSAPDGLTAFGPQLWNRCQHWMAEIAQQIAHQCHNSKVVWASASFDVGASRSNTTNADTSRSNPTTIAIRVLHLCPTTRMLSLPGWRATAEGELNDGDLRVLWISHDVEKGLRLLLRQSHAMLEWLAAPLLPNTNPHMSMWSTALRHLAPGAVHRGAIATYLAMVRWHLDHGHVQAAVHYGLTGLMLARSNTLCTCPMMLRRWATAQGLACGATEWNQTDHALGVELEQLLSNAECALPAQAPAYNDLSQFLVRLRKADLVGSFA